MPTLYNSAIFIPSWAKTRQYTGPLKYSKHARDEAAADRYGDVTSKLPRFIPDDFQLVEVEIEDGVCVKQMWRGRLTDELDLVMPVVSSGVVTTVWINHKDDKHRTLQRHKYATR